MHRMWPWHEAPSHTQKTGRHTATRAGHALPCCQLVKRRSILAAVPPHCIGVHVWRGVAWCGDPPSKEELNMTECWQCNHVDHKAVPQTPTDGASKRRQATGCNVILQLVCSSAATCGICAAANRRIWLHTTKDHGQTAGGAGRKQCSPLLTVRKQQ